MKKTPQQIRKDIVISKQAPLMRKLKINFYIACLNHIFVILVVFLTQFEFAKSFNLFQQIDKLYVLLIEPISLLITSIILISISIYKEKQNNFVSRFTNIIPYLFGLLFLISLLIINFEYLIGIIILNILNKIWSANEAGEKNNLYLSTLIFIPIAISVSQNMITPVFGFILYLVFIFIIKIVVFQNEYKKIYNIKNQDIETILS